ncbi:hypothetical protein CALCODRAFT_483027, partial [Calocera cornea HHB12733]
PPAPPTPVLPSPPAAATEQQPRAPQQPVAPLPVPPRPPAPPRPVTRPTPPPPQQLAPPPPPQQLAPPPPPQQPALPPPPQSAPPPPPTTARPAPPSSAPPTAPTTQLSHPSASLVKPVVIGDELEDFDESSLPPPAPPRPSAVDDMFLDGLTDALQVRELMPWVPTEPEVIADLRAPKPAPVPRAYPHAQVTGMGSSSSYGPPDNANRDPLGVFRDANWRQHPVAAASTSEVVEASMYDPLLDPISELFQPPPARHPDAPPVAKQQPKRKKKKPQAAVANVTPESERVKFQKPFAKPQSFDQWKPLPAGPWPPFDGKDRVITCPGGRDVHILVAEIQRLRTPGRMLTDVSINSWFTLLQAGWPFDRPRLSTPRKVKVFDSLAYAQLDKIYDLFDSQPEVFRVKKRKWAETWIAVKAKGHTKASPVLDWDDAFTYPEWFIPFCLDVHWLGARVSWGERRILMVDSAATPEWKNRVVRVQEILLAAVQHAGRPLPGWHFGAWTAANMQVIHQGSTNDCGLHLMGHGAAILNGHDASAMTIPDMAAFRQWWCLEVEKGRSVEARAEADLDDGELEVVEDDDGIEEAWDPGEVIQIDSD